MNNNTPPLNIYRKIAGFFILITVFLVLIILYYSVSYAYIKIKPSVTDKTIDFNILVTENENAYDVEKGILKGTLIDQTLEVEGDFQTTGKNTIVKDGTAKVVIINNNTRDQGLVKTTRLLTTDSVLFRINDTINVTAGGRTEVDIYQDNPEVSAIIKIGDKFTIPGLNSTLQPLIYAELIVDPTGEQVEVSVLSQEDLDLAISNLIEKVKLQISSSLNQDEISILQSNILEQNLSAPVLSIADAFHLKIKVNLKGVIVNNNDVLAYSNKIYENNLLEDEAVNDPTKLATKLEVDSIDQESGVVQLAGVVEGGVILRKNSEILNKEKLYKLNSEEAIAYLTNSDLVDSVTVSFFPFWVKKIPSFSDHVIIELK